MNKVKVLPRRITDKIAAGEVVERPAAVVKELVENAIDAGSDRIEIRFEDAGRRSIIVSDNGCGISPEDIQVICQPHATSKIDQEVDLEKIETLGFRGEALSSISAVSMFRLQSALCGAESAWELSIEGGERRALARASRNQGTTVEVRQLFFNTPARLKFLKSAGSETSQIIRTVTELALAYSEIGFRLVNGKQEVFNLHPGQDQRERIELLLGRDVAVGLLPVKVTLAPLTIRGFISPAGKGWATRNNQFIFVNRRPVSDRTITHALIAAYSGLLGEREFPAALLFLETPPEMVDVNVHPNKREVRFHRAYILHDVMVSSLRRVLTEQAAPEDDQSLFESRAAGTVQKDEPHGWAGVPRQDFSPLASELFDSAVSGMSAPASVRGERLDYFYVNNTFIVFPDKDGLTIIDQHAAHERIIFDELSACLKRHDPEKQRLLVPVTLHPGKARIGLMREYLSLLGEMGFELEEFGADSFALYAYPVIIGEIDYTRFFDHLIAELEDFGSGSDMDRITKELLSRIACHSAIRAGERLSSEQIEALRQGLRQTPIPQTCPHGRPTTLRIDSRELERRFKRV